MDRIQYNPAELAELAKTLGPKIETIFRTLDIAFTAKEDDDADAVGEIFKQANISLHHEDEDLAASKINFVQGHDVLLNMFSDALKKLPGEPNALRTLLNTMQANRAEAKKFQNDEDDSYFESKTNKEMDDFFEQVYYPFLPITDEQMQAFESLLDEHNL